MRGLLKVEGITAGYEGRAVIRNVSLEVGKGEFCALLGRNGSGKTTLLKALCGLIPAQSGRCLVDGLDCTRHNERKRARYISYTPQRHSKLQGVTVLDAVLMGYNPHLPLLGSPGRTERKRAEDMLAQMGLTELTEQDFSKLSEGQKQLVILTRALVQNAPVMLMDEPDSALDLPNRHAILKTIGQLISREGKAGLITLHDPNSALAYCDRIFLLQDGVVVGQLVLAETTCESVEKALSVIYGDIEVWERNGKFVVFLK